MKNGIALHRIRLSPDSFLNKRPQSPFCPGSLGPRPHGRAGAGLGSEGGRVLLSRYGCCPDGVSAAEGPQQAGCTRSHGSDNAGNRPGSRAGASKVSGSRGRNTAQGYWDLCSFSLGTGRTL